MERINHYIQITYHVNPLVFAILYLVSIPIYWYGWYMVAQGLWGLAWQRAVKGIIINRFAWFLPYLYVIAMGRNLPKWFWASLVILVACSSLLFVVKVRDRQIPREVRWLMTKLGLTNNRSTGKKCA